MLVCPRDLLARPLLVVRGQRCLLVCLLASCSFVFACLSCGMWNHNPAVPARAVTRIFMLLYLQDLGGAIARARKWTFTYIDCHAISDLTLDPIISYPGALVKLVACLSIATSSGPLLVDL